MRTLIKQVPPGLMALALFTLLFLFANIADAQSHVVIKGTLLASPDTDAQPCAELIATNGEHMRVTIRPNGRFWVNAPTGDTYVLRFSQPGSITKDVTVDARSTDYKLRTVTFDVVLHGPDGDEAMRFAAPVGRIEFRQGEKRPHVAHHYELMPVSTLIAQEGR